MSPLLVFALCITAAVAVGYLRSLELAKPRTLRGAGPMDSSPRARLAPKRAASRMGGPEDLTRPEAA